MCAVPSSPCRPAGGTGSDVSLVLRDVTVVDPSREGSTRHDLVVGADGFISQLAAPGRGIAERTVEASGLVVFPGLIDCHVHLCFDPTRSPEDWIGDASDDELAAMVREHGRATLAAGVTTVRDLGSRGDVVRHYSEEVETGAVIGPRVISAGPVVTVPNGHCFFVGDEVRNNDHLVKVVAQHVSAGDSWVKVMVTGGALTSTSDPDVLQFHLREVTLVVQLARAAGLATAAHVLTSQGAEIAISAGVNTVEHGVGATLDQLRRMRDGGQALVPVLTPSALLLRDDPDGTSRHVVRLRAIVERLRSTVRQAVASGVDVLVGTDAGCPSVPHGRGVLEEITLLESLGLPRRAALVAATGGAAAGIGLRGEGRLAVGSRADLLLLDGDPMLNLDALAAPVAVLAKGRTVHPRDG